MLTRLDGVSGTKLRVTRETRIEIFTRKGIWLAPALYLKQIAKGGFMVKPNDIAVTMTGTVVVEGATRTLRVDQPGGATLDVRLENSDAASGASVEVTGGLRPLRPDTPLTLWVRKTRPVKAPA